MFDVAVGERAISHAGHLKMMGATQPFLSGAISKTVNILDGHGRGHRRRLHRGVATRHQGARDLPRRFEDRPGAPDRRPPGRAGIEGGRDPEGGRRGARQGPCPPPDAARAPFDHPQVLDRRTRGYITAAMYEDGTVGEIFLTDIGKEGSTLRGMMNSFATAISIALQTGVPLETLVRKFSYMRFEPEGMTTNPEIRSQSRCPTTSCAGSPRDSSTSTSRRSSGS